MVHLKRTVSDLWRAFEIQKQALDVSIQAFDAGMKGEAARLATSAFLLVGRGMKSHKSILDQLNLQERLGFVTTSASTKLVYAVLTPVKPNQYNLALFPKGLQDVREVSFFDWWNEKVVHRNNGELSRSQVIRILRDKDGGAHFAEFVRDPLVADALTGRLSDFYFANPPEPAQPVAYGLETYMRQIAEELRATIRDLKPDTA